ncbi:CopG family transcriptional regulator [Candidatus Methylobacter favarea]|uniref:CopG family transcriptional regulator n=1 Tax=Candidatus Methylobacter favarea TaxID=2707345 RepID=A0A8S0X2Q3_9GAMM|nr:CopG family ribbon-helix-helix protein [Candidatus Methylobacter favarea]CAA9892104.1 CopG family transcriptional regulator [Candidatus Methylobacter favarea]
MTSKAVKLDDAIYARLKVLAETRQRTPHWLMKEAIRQFLEREEAAEQLRLDTLQRLAQLAADGKVISHDLVDAWLSTWGTETEGQCPVV